MSNISFFFPKRVQGASLGLNAGLGNFGVPTMQILIPLVAELGFLASKRPAAKKLSDPDGQVFS